MAAPKPPRKVVMVSELFHPETNATAKYLSRIACGLASDFPVHAICGQPRYDIREKAPRREAWDKVQITRCAGTRFDKNNLAGRAINAVSITISMAWAGLRLIRRGDVVVAVTNPPTMPPLFQKIARWKKARFVLLVHDLYPEAIIAAGLTSPDSKLAAKLRRASERLMRNADRIVAIGRCMRQRCLSRLEGTEDKVAVIPNFANAALDSGQTPNPIRLKLGLQDRFVVQMAGNIGRTHGLEAILEAAEKLIESDVHFMIVGQGAKRGWLEQQIQNRKLRNVTLHDFFPADQLNDSISACDVQVISFLPGMSGVSVPSRMYNILAAGIPLIACSEDDSELSLVIRENRVGWVVPPGDGDALARAIQNAKREFDPEMSVRAQRVVSEKYCEERVLLQWRDLLHDLLTQV